MKPESNVLDSGRWKSAVTGLFRGAWPFVQVGPRAHDDWRRDVVKVMALEASDPRWWFSLNYAPEVAGVRNGVSPFTPWNHVEIGKALFEVGRPSAVQLLVALQGDGYRADGIIDFESHRDQFFEFSRTILSRFGSTARFFANAAAARGNPNADLLNPDTEWECLSVYTTDCGLVAVSEDEVGVFWAFWED